ncbi:hypothetical protein [Bacillus sp. mrc49]|uniref:hypothetical protein n=1 Tax=Bacillus sp. mrc49 TaxID=2054913 RepID=UPI000C278E36|nr:hypothetical protein [Bacillus sp. mrc49]PJN88403.1 hypothetical protein CVN76_20775 [Bacillus sp. mrc49]
MNKNFILFFIVALFSILGANQVFANGSNERFLEKTDVETGDPYLEDADTNEKIYEAFKTDADGNLVQIDLDEYKQLMTSNDDIETNEELELKENIDSKIKITPRSPLTYETFRYSGEKGKSVVNGSRRKVTPDIKGPGSITYGESVTVNNSFTGSYSASFESKVKSSASFSWQKSLTSLSKFSTTFPVSKGKTGYVSFTPYMNKTWGTGYKETRNTAGIVISTKSLGTQTGFSPKKTSSGKADGLYALIYK